MKLFEKGDDRFIIPDLLNQNYKSHIFVLVTYFLNTYNYLFFFTGQHGVKMAEVKCSNKETVISAEFHPMDPGLIVTCGKGHVNFWHLGLVFSIKLTEPLASNLSLESG